MQVGCRAGAGQMQGRCRGDAGELRLRQLARPRAEGGLVREPREALRGVLGPSQLLRRGLPRPVLGGRAAALVARLQLHLPHHAAMRDAAAPRRQHELHVRAAARRAGRRHGRDAAAAGGRGGRGGRGGGVASGHLREHGARVGEGAVDLILVLRSPTRGRAGRTLARQARRAAWRLGGVGRASSGRGARPMVAAAAAPAGSGRSRAARGARAFISMQSAHEASTCR